MAWIGQRPLALHSRPTATLPDFGFACLFLFALLLHRFSLLAAFALAQPVLLLRLGLLQLLVALFLGP